MAASPPPVLHPVPTQQQIDHVVRDQLRRLAEATAAANRGISFIQLWNGGGAIAALSFWGAVEEVRGTCSAIISLVAFLLGLLSAAVTVVVSYEHARMDYNRFNSMSGLFFSRQIGWQDLYGVESPDQARVATIAGYLSLLLAIGGTAAGAIAVLNR